MVHVLCNKAEVWGWCTSRCSQIKGGARRYLYCANKQRCEGTCCTIQFVQISRGVMCDGICIVQLSRGVMQVLCLHVKLLTCFFAA